MHDGPRQQLDPLEELLLEALLDEDLSPEERTAALRQMLTEAGHKGMLDPALPPPDSAPRTRAGYTLAGDPDSKHARVEPTLALTLATLAHAGRSVNAGELRRRFPDLGAIDLALWQALDATDVVEPSRLASLWLRSPGRRLVQDLDLLHVLATPTAMRPPMGATETDPDSLRRAAGIDGMPCPTAELASWLRNGRPSRWRDLHTAVPGLLMRLWQPQDGKVTTAQDGKVTTALRRLESGNPYTLRGAALGWLLDRAVDQPFYELEGIRRDLREDLPWRLATALEPDASADAAFGPELEAVVLQHAVRVADPDGTRGDQPDTILAAWGLSRWMQRCLVRSPFFGADEESLTVRLQAMLDTRKQEPGHDPLHPARFGPAGIDLADLALVAGVVSHYGRSGLHLDPMPLALVNALRHIAGRTLRPLEQQAEDAYAPPASPPDALGTPGNALGWGAPHIAPPWVARRILTDRRITWLTRVGNVESVTRECLDQLERRPPAFSWLAFVFYTEGHELAGALREQASETWRTLADTYEQVEDKDAAMPAHALAAMAAGILPALQAEELGRALDIAASATEEWRPFLFDAFAEAAGRTWSGKHEDRVLELAWQQAVERLVDAVEAADRTPRERLNSALMALRRAAARRGNGGGPLIERLARAVAEPPFRDHRALQREARRLGLDTVSSRP